MFTVFFIFPNGKNGLKIQFAVCGGVSKPADPSRGQVRLSPPETDRQSTWTLTEQCRCQI